MLYAPIVVFAYNRIDELKLTITSLQKNILAKESILIVYSDAAKTDNNTSKVKEVRKYLSEVEGFRSVSVIHREKNFGLARSVIEGSTEVLNKYAKIIVLEDDLITSENFLLYMNDALEFAALLSERPPIAVSNAPTVLPILP